MVNNIESRRFTPMGSTILTGDLADPITAERSHPIRSSFSARITTSARFFEPSSSPHHSRRRQRYRPPNHHRRCRHHRHCHKLHSLTKQPYPRFQSFCTSLHKTAGTVDGTVGTPHAFVGTDWVPSSRCEERRYNALLD